MKVDTSYTSEEVRHKRTLTCDSIHKKGLEKAKWIASSQVLGREGGGGGGP